MAMSGTRVGSGTWASSAWRTIGARVPSTSSSTALCDGSTRSGSSAAAMPSSDGRSWRARDTALVCPVMPRRRLLALAATGTLAGLFSGLFGIGGGTVMVPLLILWLGYGEREATGTSLAAIPIIAAFGAALEGGLHGNLDIPKG